MQSGDQGFRGWEHTPRWLALMLITNLALLVVCSFKSLVLHGAVLSANSILCVPLVWLYWLVRVCATPRTQRHILHVAIMGLYIFSAGLYVVLNLPSTHYLQDPLARQIVFEDIPRQFFATTVAFGVAFYLPGLIWSRREERHGISAAGALAEALCGGILFLIINFEALFSQLHAVLYSALFPSSAGNNALLLSMTAVVILLLWGGTDTSQKKDFLKGEAVPHLYLEGAAAALILVSLMGEFRLLAWMGDGIMPGSAVLLPCIFLVSNYAVRRCGPNAGLRIAGGQLWVQVVFALVLFLIIGLPAPSDAVSDILYTFVLPARIPISVLVFSVMFCVNGWILSGGNPHHRFRFLRYPIANASAALLQAGLNILLLSPAIFSVSHVRELATGTLWYLAFTGIPCWIVLWMLRSKSRKRIALA